MSNIRDLTDRTRNLEERLEQIKIRYDTFLTRRKNLAKGELTYQQLGRKEEPVNTNRGIIIKSNEKLEEVVENENEEMGIVTAKDDEPTGKMEEEAYNGGDESKDKTSLERLRQVQKMIDEKCWSEKIPEEFLEKDDEATKSRKSLILRNGRKFNFDGYCVVENF